MKEKNKNNNRKLLLSLAGVLLLVALVIGITYAAWTYTFNGTKVSSLSTADIKLELLESDDNVINITNALPMSDAQGKAQQQVFDFVVTSKTVRDIDVDYTVSMEKLTADTGYTLLNDNQIKLYLTDGSGSPIWTEATNNVKKVSDLTNYVLTTGQHSHDSTHNKVQDKYKLKVWIDSEVDASSWTSSTKYQYKFRIGVTGGEHVASAQTTTVYRFNSTDVDIGDTLTSSDYVLDPSALEDNEDSYFKHTLDGSNQVTETYVCVVFNSVEYCLQAEDTRTQPVDYVSGYYASNVSVLESLTGGSFKCDQTYGIGYCEYDNGDYDLYADETGDVSIIVRAIESALSAGGNQEYASAGIHYSSD